MSEGVSDPSTVAPSSNGAYRVIFDDSSPQEEEIQTSVSPQATVGNPPSSAQPELSVRQRYHFPLAPFDELALVDSGTDPNE